MMAIQVLPPLPADAATQITYISGFNADGTVAGTTSSTFDATTRQYNTTTSQAFKWGGGQPDANGAPTGPNPTAGTPGGTLSYAFVGTFSGAEQATFLAAMQAWTNVANIQFSAAASVATADFTFNRNMTGQAFQTAERSAQSPLGATRVSAEFRPTISIDMRPGGGFGNWANDFSDGGNSYNTAIHEVGHLLGLGHGGPYNEGEGTGGAGAPANQFSIFDQTPFTLMSYITPGDANARLFANYTSRADYGFSADGTIANQATTPQLLDILAIQRIYGAATTGTSTQAQTFGFNTTITDATRAFFDFSINTRPVVTIYGSAPSGNALNLSGFAQAATVNLAPGSISSVGGLTNNLTLAFGTTISSVVGGGGADRIVGFIGAENIIGGGGADTITGGGGADTAAGNLGDDAVYGNLGSDLLFGGQGNDTVVGGQNEDTASGNLGDDAIYGNLGNDALFGGQGNDTLFGGQGSDTLNGNLGDDLLFGNLGADRFVVGPNAGNDRIGGFDLASGDRIALVGQTYTAGQAADGSALLTLSGGGTVNILGIAPGDVNAGFFV